MAKKRTKKLNIEAFMEKDIAKMSRGELAKYLTPYVSAANKRLKRLQESGLYSPALEHIKSSGGKFSVSDKNLNQLRNEWKRLSGFLDPERRTSTVRGVKQIRKEFEERVKDERDDTLDKLVRAHKAEAEKEGLKFDEHAFREEVSKNWVPLTEDDYRTYWDIYRAVESGEIEISGAFNSNTVQRLLRAEFEINPTVTVNEFSKTLENLYKLKEKAEQITLDDLTTEEERSVAYDDTVF